MIGSLFLLAIQTWTFHNDPAALTEVLKQNDLSVDYFKEALNRFDIELKQEDAPYLPLNPIPFENPTSAQNLKIIWEDEYTQIIQPPKPLTPHHLWVTLKTPKNSYLDITDDEVLLLHETLRNVIDTFYSEHGFFHYSLSFNNHIFEFIPSRAEAKQHLDFDDKMQRNAFYLLRQYFPIKNPADPAPFSLNPANPIQYPHYHEDIMINEVKCRYHQISDVYDVLLKYGFTIDRQIHVQDLPDDPKIRPHPRLCAFCNPTVITKQSVYKDSLINVLLNFQSCTHKSGFLIIPHRHIEHYTELTTPELLDIHHTMQKLITAMQTLHNRSDVIMMLQDGYPMGQTVYHTHFHLMLAPLPLRYLFQSIYNTPHFQPKETDYADLRKDLAPLLQ